MPAPPQPNSRDACRRSCVHSRRPTRTRQCAPNQSFAYMTAIYTKIKTGPAHSTPTGAKIRMEVPAKVRAVSATLQRLPRQSSPRSRRMMSSEVRSSNGPPASGRRRASASRRARNAASSPGAASRSMRTPPSGRARTVTRSPGRMPAASRTALGNVTCPFAPTFVVTEPSVASSAALCRRGRRPRSPRAASVDAVADRVGRAPEGVRKGARLSTGYGARLQPGGAPQCTVASALRSGA